MKPPTKTSVAKSASGSRKQTRFPGKMGKNEIQPLIMAAREAFAYQESLGNIDSGVTFDTWRRDQVMAAVGREGLSKCHHDDYRPLMGHFQVLAGRDAEAFQSFVTTGNASRAAHDTHETRRKLAHAILEVLSQHIWLADVSAVDLATSTNDTRSYNLLQRRRACIRAHKDGAIREGYVVWLVRQKTCRPGLTLGSDLQAGLADRCTVDQLTQIRDTLINRIAAREGREDRGRNKGQKSRLDRPDDDHHTARPNPF